MTVAAVHMFAWLSLMAIFYSALRRKRKP